jgi:hypothetical protein
MRLQGSVVPIQVRQGVFSHGFPSFAIVADLL